MSTPVTEACAIAGSALITSSMRQLLYSVLLFVVVAGCATSRSDMPPPKSRVEAAFQKAERAMERGDYIDASARYNAIRSQYPYSQFATLADLRLADAYYEEKKFTSAISQYRSFIKLHPNHPKVTYASYRVADSFVGQMPKPFVLLPPVHERELVSTKDAERELEYFIKKYPETEFTADAKRELALVRRRLADHEMYVAQFYLKKRNPRAAAMRLTYLLANYSGVGLDPQALFLLGRSYLQLGDVAKAKTALDDLVANFSEEPLARQARNYMRRHKL